ncbi:hypothetical protein VPHD482_0373 [Vibrio phage D482]
MIPLGTKKSLFFFHFSFDTRVVFLYLVFIKTTTENNMTLLEAEHETAIALFKNAGFDVKVNPRSKVVDAYKDDEFIYRFSADSEYCYLESMTQNLDYWISYTPALASANELAYWLEVV